MHASRTTRILIYVGVPVIVIAILLYFGLQTRSKKVHKQVISVTIATIAKKSVPVIYTAPGKVEAVESVNVRSQVGGVLNKINFKAGDDVKANQLLFQIDSAPFETALEQAKANLARDTAQLNETKKNVQRFRALAINKYVSQQAFGQVVSQAAMQNATVKADLEKIKEAQLRLDYTQIKAPISGKTGDISVKVGDLITASNSQPLVTINKINPVYVTFNLPQRKLPGIMVNMRKSRLVVEVYPEKDNKLIGKGVLDFVDNTIDTDTGTILLKGLIDNKDEMLWPAQLVTVKLILKVKQNALVVPSSAVKNDEKGQFLYLVKGKDKVEIVRLAKAHQLGKLTEIESDQLKQGDRIVAVVPPTLEEDSEIKISNPGK